MDDSDEIYPPYKDMQFTDSMYGRKSPSEAADSQIVDALYNFAPLKELAP